MSAPTTFDSQFEVRQVLGQALYGQVARVQRRDAPEAAPVVAKILDRRLMGKRRARNGVAVLEDPEREAALLRLARCSCSDEQLEAALHCTGRCARAGHAHLVSSLPAGDALRDERRHVVLLPLYAHGDLFERVARAGRLDAAEARRLFRGVLAGVARLHALGWVHRDVSLENVMMDGDEPVLIDFGLAAPIDSVNESTAHRPGKLGYMAPDVYKHQHKVNSAALDVFSLGVVLHILLTGVPPFERADRSDRRYAAVQRGRLGALLRNWGIDDVPPAALALVERMLAEDAAARPTMKEVLGNAWVCSGTAGDGAASAAAVSGSAMPAPPAPAESMSIGA